MHTSVRLTAADSRKFPLCSPDDATPIYHRLIQRQQIAHRGRSLISTIAMLICCATESEEKLEEDQEDDEVGFEGTPKPMLPYSSLFIFGPTNP